jgi:adenosylhomocysteine nucleosidase
MKVTAIVAALPEEVAALRIAGARKMRAGRTPIVLGRLGGRPVALAVTGDGEVNARRGIAEVLTSLEVEQLIVVGVGGALTPGLDAAAVVVGRTVISPGSRPVEATAALVELAVRSAGARRGVVVNVPDLVASPEEKQRLWQRVGAADEPTVVDLETAAFAAAADAAGVPWVVLRAVSDTAAETVPSFVGRYRDERGLRRGRLLAHALTHPSAISALWHLDRRVRTCSRALSLSVEKLIVGLAGAPGIALAR